MLLSAGSFAASFARLCRRLLRADKDPPLLLVLPPPPDAKRPRLSLLYVRFPLATVSLSLLQLSRLAHKQQDDPTRWSATGIAWGSGRLERMAGSALHSAGPNNGTAPWFGGAAGDWLEASVGLVGFTGK